MTKVITLDNGAEVHLWNEAEYRKRWNLTGPKVFSARGCIYGDAEDDLFDAGDVVHINATAILRTLRIPVLGRYNVLTLLGHEICHETKPPGHDHPSNRWPDKRDVKSIMAWVKPILAHAAKHGFGMVAATGLLRWFPKPTAEYRMAKDMLKAIKPHLRAVATGS